MKSLKLVKAVVASLALAASAPSFAAIAYDDGGELFLNIYNSTSGKSFTMDLPSLTGNASFNSFAISDFLPANFNNAQGLTSLTPGTVISGGGAAEAAGLNLSWTLAQSGAFQSFYAENTNTALWKWNVVALDTNGSSTSRNAQRYLTTLSNPPINPFNQGSGAFSQMSTVSTYIDAVNAATANADSSAYMTTTDFRTMFGDTWKGNLGSSASAVGSAAPFYYLTGRSSIAINEPYENASWNFTMDALTNVGTLSYTVAAVPEADSSLMLLAGIGLMGFIARRRSNI